MITAEALQLIHMIHRFSVVSLFNYRIGIKRGQDIQPILRKPLLRQQLPAETDAAPAAAPTGSREEVQARLEQVRAALHDIRSAVVRLLFDGKDLGMVAVRVADADGHGVADLPAEDRLARETPPPRCRQ